MLFLKIQTDCSDDDERVFESSIIYWRIKVRNVCLSLVTTVTICVVSLFLSEKTYAQSAPQPAVVVSLAPLGEQMKDLKYLVNASGFGQMNFFIQAQVKHFAAGIALDRPSGMMLFFQGDDPEPKWLGFVAVENVEAMLDRIAEFADVDEEDDQILISPENGDEIVAKEVNGYLLIADDKEMFALAPASPAAELGDLPNNHNVAARVFGQRIPQELRQKGIDLISEGYARQMEELGKDGDELFDTQLEQIKSFVNDTEEIMVGFQADKELGKLSAKVIFRGTPGSELAKRCNVMKDLTTGKFSGFLNSEAAFNANMRAKIIKEDIESYNTLLDQLRKQLLEEIDADGELDEEEFAELETLADDMISVLKETIAEGEFDGGALMMVDKGSMNFAGGAKIASPQKLEKSIKSLVEMAQEKSGDVIDAKFNSGSYDGITFHTINVSVPSDEEEVRKVVGDKMTIMVGIGTDSAYVCGGSDPLPLLKASIEKSKTTAELESLNQYNVFLAPVLRFASGITPEPALEKMAEALAENGKDRISIFSDVIENGIESRLEMEDGILSLIQAGFEAAQAGAFQDVDEF